VFCRNASPVEVQVDPTAEVELLRRRAAALEVEVEARTREIEQLRAQAGNGNGNGRQSDDGMTRMQEDLDDTISRLDETVEAERRLAGPRTTTNPTEPASPRRVSPVRHGGRDVDISRDRILWRGFDGGGGAGRPAGGNGFWPNRLRDFWYNFDDIEVPAFAILSLLGYLFFSLTLTLLSIGGLSDPWSRWVRVLVAAAAGVPLLALLWVFEELRERLLFFVGILFVMVLLWYPGHLVLKIFGIDIVLPHSYWVFFP
jgi:hypothetical protein